MDGVCCDFASAAMSLWGKTANDLPVGERNIPKALGIEPKVFWDTIHGQGFRFWSGLKEYPWFQELYSELGKMGEIEFLTSPPVDESEHAIKGKMIWLRKRLGNDFNSVTFTQNKHRFASYNKLLVDDYIRNAVSFVTHGGMSQLFKMRWNSPAKFEPQERLYDCLEGVRKQIHRYERIAG